MIDDAFLVLVYFAGICGLIVVMGSIEWCFSKYGDYLEWKKHTKGENNGR